MVGDKFAVYILETEHARREYFRVNYYFHAGDVGARDDFRVEVLTVKAFGDAATDVVDNGLEYVPVAVFYE